MKISKELYKQIKLTEDSYSGGGGFADGDYIFKFAREMDYDKRKAMAYYVNYIGSIVDATVDPVFSTEPQRSYDSNDIIEAFIKDADAAGTSLTEMIHKAVTMTSLISNSFLIVDNFVEIPKTQKDVIEERKFPYIYSKQMSDLFDFDTNEFDVITSITFHYGEKTLTDGKKVKLYKTYTEESIEIFYFKNNVSGETVSVKSEVNTIGVIPVVFYNKIDAKNPPTYYSMATLARAIYNTTSEIQDLQRAQSFSILLMPSTSPGDDDAENLIISSHNAIFFDSESKNSPSFISPDAAIMAENRETLKTQMELLIQQADVLGTTALSNSGNGAVSGIAYSYKFFGKQQKLQDASVIATSLEKPVIDIVAMYAGIDNLDYSVEYQNTFSPTFSEVKGKIESLDTVVKMEISKEVSTLVSTDIVKIIADVMRWDDDVLEGAIKSISYNKNETDEL